MTNDRKDYSRRSRYSRATARALIDSMLNHPVKSKHTLAAIAAQALNDYRYDIALMQAIGAMPVFPDDDFRND